MSAPLLEDAAARTTLGARNLCSAAHQACISYYCGHSYLALQVCNLVYVLYLYCFIYFSI